MPDVDFSALPEASGPAPIAIVRGPLTSVEFRPVGTIARLTVREAWTRVGEEREALTFFRIGDNGIRCFTTPCFSTDVEVVNHDRVETLSSLDLSGVGASPDEIGVAYEAIADRRLIVDGVRAPATEPTGRAIAAQQIFLPLGTPCQADEECGVRAKCNAADVCLPPPGCRSEEACADVCSGYCIADPGRVACNGDSDCALSEWCRSESSGRYCTPFALGGEPCEGFTLPEYFERCSPGLCCQLSEPTGDAGGTCQFACQPPPAVGGR